MEPIDPIAKELMPDQPILGFGKTPDEARFDGMQAFARSLSKLTPEQTARIGLQAVDSEDSRPLGLVSGEVDFVSDPEEIERILRERGRASE